MYFRETTYNRGHWRLIAYLTVVGVCLVLTNPVKNVDADIDTTITSSQIAVEEPETTGESLVNNILLQEIRKLAAKNSSFAVITFETDNIEQPLIQAEELHPRSDSKKGYRVGRHPGSVVVPATEISSKSAFPAMAYKDIFHIQGTFRLRQRLQGRLLDMGHVQKDISLDFWSTHGLVERRLEPFQIMRFAYPAKPLLLLAAFPPGTNHILDGAFFALGSSRELTWLKEGWPLLISKDLKDLPCQQARRLLHSSNPWLIWLGLRSLEEQRALTSTDFSKAFSSLSLYSSANSVLDDLLFSIDSLPRVPLLKIGFEQAVAAKLNPRRFEKVSKVLSSKLHSASLDNLGSLEDLKSFQRAVRVYRSRIVGDAKMQALNSQMNELELSIESWLRRLQGGKENKGKGTKEKGQKGSGIKAKRKGETKRVGTEWHFQVCKCRLVAHRETDHTLFLWFLVLSFLTTESLENQKGKIKSVRNRFIIAERRENGAIAPGEAWEGGKGCNDCINETFRRNPAGLNPAR